MSEEDPLIDAVHALRLSEPGLSAKQVHARLVSEAAWEAATLGDVKKACSKATKRYGAAVAALAPRAAVELPNGQGYYKHAAPSVHGLWPETGAYGTSKCEPPRNSSADPTKLFSCYDVAPANESVHQMQFEVHEWEKVRPRPGRMRPFRSPRAATALADPRG